MKNIYFTGFMASGKTTITKLVAKKLSTAYFDLDEEIVKYYGMEISEIFSNFGESGFREREKETLERLVKKRPRNTIISLGGGTIVDPSNFNLVKNNGIVIYLEADVDTIYNRVAFARNKRPLLQVKDVKKTIKTLMDKRNDVYLQSADIVVFVSGKSAFEVTRDTIHKIKTYK